MGSTIQLLIRSYSPISLIITAFSDHSPPKNKAAIKAALSNNLD